MRALGHVEPAECGKRLLEVANVIAMIGDSHQNASDSAICIRDRSLASFPAESEKPEKPLRFHPPTVDSDDGRLCEQPPV
jgi:hypothetical protein